MFYESRMAGSIRFVVSFEIAALGRQLGRERFQLACVERVERWDRNAQDSEVNVNLAAVMNFVFEHGAQQFPGSDGNTFGRSAFLLEVLLRHSAENLH